MNPGPILTLDDLKRALPDGSSLPLDPELMKWQPQTWEDMEDARLLPRWRQLLAYEPETGHLWSRFWFFHENTRHKARITHRVGGMGGWNRVEVDKRKFTAAHVVWFLHHGTWPRNGKLARQDGNRCNDRIENLYDPVSLRHPGVRRFQDGWEAFVVEEGRKHRLGVFMTEEAAIEAHAKWQRGELFPAKRKPARGVARYYDRWQAYAPLPLGKRKFLGVFATEAEALAARAAWDADNEAWRQALIGGAGWVGDLV